MMTKSWAMVFAVAVLIGVTATPALGNMDVQGILYAGQYGVVVDSVTLMVESLPFFFPAPGLQVNPAGFDTALFAGLAGWPSRLTVHARLDRIYRMIDINHPIEDTWYFFAVSGERPAVKIQHHTGVTVNTPTEIARLRVAPTVAHGPVVVSTTPSSDGAALEVYDAAGNLVRVLESSSQGSSRAWVWSGDGADGRRMAEGVYYFRLPRDGSVVVGKVLLVN